MKEVHELISMDEVEVFLDKNRLSSLYISRPDCSVCHALLPKLQSLLMNYPNIQLGHINADQTEEVAAKFFVFSVPTILFMNHQREYLRTDRFVRLNELSDKIGELYDHIFGDNT
ncbi:MULTISPECIES: thioredoxin family protein [Paenibacillus]|uniref:thioredoxin family protein n=1 Tax=Paenibacillus TaxID=44249 RepID=UPI0022B89B92|nr:thioredoxin family protein [Paenibacillus caseinilyticus]MCZ8521858.1 thioredoxin family protein [Paenibacillus caseinilyticus]